jgi:hypothetical protein
VAEAATILTRPVFFFTHAWMTALEGCRPPGWAASATPVTSTSGSAASKTRLRGRRMWISSRSVAPTDTGAWRRLRLSVRLPARLRFRVVQKCAPAVLAAPP